MIERIALALGIDSADLFITEMKKAESFKTFRKATIKDVKNLLCRYLDGKLADLDKNT
jgi:hypothetical protein